MLALRLASYGSPAPAGSRRSSVRTQANTGRTGARAKTGSSSRSMEKPGPLQDRPPLKAATPAGDADEVERLKALLADERAKARGGILSAALALATVLVLPPTATQLQDEVARLRERLTSGTAPTTSSSDDGRSSPALLAERPQPHKLVAFSGGTGFNSLCAELRKYTTHVAHVIPVSDDGGSTAEIVRVLGGPAVGDIRSRCLRLADDSVDEARAVRRIDARRVRRLLKHRLPLDSARAKSEWHEIVEGDSPLWTGVSEPYKHTVRSFLVHFHFQLLREASTRSAQFDFSGGSIGNFFFAGARIFFSSLDAAIFLFSRVSGIPKDSVVLPVVSTMGRLMLGAELMSGELLRGQSNISHPDAPTSPSATTAAMRAVDKSRGGSCETPLPSPIKRVLYLSTETTDELHEVFPPVNPGVLSRIRNSDGVVYGIGSLWSSVCVSLIAVGVGESVAETDCAKVLMLNGTRDRETTGMTAVDVVWAITNSLNRARSTTGRCGPLCHPPSSYVTAILAPKGGEIEMHAQQRAELAALGITKIIEVDSDEDSLGRCVYKPAALVDALRQVVQTHREMVFERQGYVI